MQLLAASLRRRVVDLDEVRDAGDHAADLGTVGQGVGLADAAEAEGAQRAAGLRLGARWPDLTWVTVSSPLMTGAPSRPVRVAAAALALVVGVEHALGHELLGGEAAALGDLVGALQRLQPGDRGPGDVDVVGRAERLAQHVVDAGLLEDDAGGTTGDDAGTGGGRLHQHAAGAGDADDRVGDRGAGERDVEQVALGLLGALLDRQRHFLGLAVAETDAAVAVTDHDERGEREAAAAVDDLGDAVDGDDPRLAQATLGRVGTGCRLVDTCCTPSELQTCFAGRSGERGDAPVVEEPTAVEHDLVDAGGLGPLGDERAEPGGGLDGAAAAGAALSASAVEAAASVRPASSSITWATRCLLERNTARRGRVGGAVDLLAHPAVAADAGLATSLGDVGHTSSHLLLAGLAGLAQDALALVADALALVGLGLADGADVGGDLADDLLVDAVDDDLGRPPAPRR